MPTAHVKIMKGFNLAWVFLALVSVSIQAPYSVPGQSLDQGLVSRIARVDLENRPNFMTPEIPLPLLAASIIPKAFVPAPVWAHAPPGNLPLDVPPKQVDFMRHCLPIEINAVNLFLENTEPPLGKEPAKCCHAELAMMIAHGTREHGWGMSKDCERFWLKDDQGALLMWEE